MRLKTRRNQYKVGASFCAANVDGERRGNNKGSGWNGASRKNLPGTFLIGFEEYYFFSKSQECFV
jgi:hypothetical protein